MTNIGIVGIGFMGVTHYKAIDQLPDVQVSAICTRSSEKLEGDWRAIKGNFGDDGGVHDLSNTGCYQELADLLADESVDIVDICLPSDLHLDATLQALEAGKHVLLEKPIALSVADADLMVAAAAANDRVFCVAHVLRYFPEFALIRSLRDSGEYGDILALSMRRAISRPAWWDADSIARSGGPSIDLHIHDADFVQMLFGMPRQVSSAGVIGEAGVVEYITTQYQYENGPGAVVAEGGWLSQGGLPFEHAYDVYFEKACLKYCSTTGEPPTLYSDDREVTNPQLSATDGFAAEIAEAVRAVAAHDVDGNMLSARSARDSLLLCRLEEESARTGRPVDC
jgi:predicted dehydrogenase